MKVFRVRPGTWAFGVRVRGPVATVLVGRRALRFGEPRVRLVPVGPEASTVVEVTAAQSAQVTGPVLQVDAEHPAVKAFVDALTQHDPEPEDEVLKVAGENLVSSAFVDAAMYQRPMDAAQAGAMPGDDPHGPCGWL